MDEVLPLRIGDNSHPKNEWTSENRQDANGYWFTRFLKLIEGDQFSLQILTYFKMKLEDIQMKLSIQKLDSSIHFGARGTWSWIWRILVDTSYGGKQLHQTTNLRLWWFLSHYVSHLQFHHCFDSKKCVFDRNFCPPSVVLQRVCCFFFKKKCWKHMNKIFLEWLQNPEKPHGHCPTCMHLTWSMTHHWCIDIFCNWLFGYPFILFAWMFAQVGTKQYCILVKEFIATNIATNWHLSNEDTAARCKK